MDVDTSVFKEKINVISSRKSYKNRQNSLVIVMNNGFTEES